MSDRHPAEIRIGGGIPTSLVEPLLEAISEDRIKLEHGECAFKPGTPRDLIEALQNDGTLRLVDEEADGGTFDNLEGFLVTHTISFDRMSSGHDYDACLTRYRPHLGDPITFPSSEYGDLLVPGTTVNTALDLLQRGKIKAAIRLLTREGGLGFPPLLPLHTIDSDMIRLPTAPPVTT